MNVLHIQVQQIIGGYLTCGVRICDVSCTRPTGLVGQPGGADQLQRALPGLDPDPRESELQAHQQHAGAQQGGHHQEPVPVHCEGQLQRAAQAHAPLHIPQQLHVHSHI
jgi:hypothetical protein